MPCGLTVVCQKENATTGKSAVVQYEVLLQIRYTWSSPPPHHGLDSFPSLGSSFQAWSVPISLYSAAVLPVRCSDETTGFVTLTSWTL